MAVKELRREESPEKSKRPLSDVLHWEKY